MLGMISSFALTQSYMYYAIFKAFHLRQNKNKPTHTCGHILDVSEGLPRTNSHLITFVLFIDVILSIETRFSTVDYLHKGLMCDTNL